MPSGETRDGAAHGGDFVDVIVKVGHQLGFFVTVTSQKAYSNRRYRVSTIVKGITGGDINTNGEVRGGVIVEGRGFEQTVDKESARERGGEVGLWGSGSGRTGNSFDDHVIIQARNNSKKNLNIVRSRTSDFIRFMSGRWGAPVRNC